MIKAPVVMSYNVGQLNNLNIFFMKKLKLGKINLSEMKLDDLNRINGGMDGSGSDEFGAFTWKKVCGTIIQWSKALCHQPTLTDECSNRLSCRAGSDSCGLCSPHYACP